MKDYFQVKRLCGHWTRIPASHVGFPWYEKSECDFCYGNNRKEGKIQEGR
jgi:hypothetical protein